MSAHHHGYLHWDAPLDPSLETIFRAFSAHGYEVGSFVFDTNYLFKDLPEANVLGTSESLDAAFGWLREKRDQPFLLYVHNWATHMPYDILHSERQDWLAAKQEVIEGIQSDSAAALEQMRERYRKAVERQSEVLVASFLEELETLGLRENTVFAFLSDHGESWGERFVEKEDVQGVYHMHGAALFDEIVQVPLILSAPGALEPAVVPSQVRTIDLMPTLLELSGLPAREMDGESLLRVDGDRPAVITGTDMGALTQLAVRMPPWKLILDVESGEEQAFHLGVDPRELDSRPGDAPSELRSLVFAELESAERHELTAEEEATVAKRLSDLGLPLVSRARRLLRADVLHPPVRGDAPRPLLARQARRDDAHVHRAGGQRGRRHRPPRARAGRDLLEPPLPRALPRVHRRRVRPPLRGHGEGAGRLRRQGRQPAPVQGQLLLERRPREHRPGRDRDRARREDEGDWCGVDGLPRRRHARRGRRVRVLQHRLALEAPRALRRREQPLRAVDARRARARRVDRRARRRVRGRDRRAGHDRRRGDPRGRRAGDRPHPRDRCALLPRAQHVPLQPALEVGRPARPGRDRGAPHA